MELSVDLLGLLGFFAAVNLLYVGVLTWWEDRSLWATRLFVALALVAAWWAAALAVVYSGLGAVYPQALSLSQFLSGFFGPLLFLFTLAFINRLPRWKLRHTLILLPGSFGTICLLLTVFVPQPPEVQAALQEFAAAFIDGAAMDEALLREHMPWFMPLQILHMLQLLGFVLASIGLFVWNSRHAASRTDRFESATMSMIYMTMLAGVIATNLLPQLGYSSDWIRVSSVLPLPFVFVLWGFLHRRMMTTKRLQQERETLVTYLPARAVDYVLSEQARGGAGQKMEAVILFADLRGFTTLSEKVDPAALVAWIDRFFIRMGEETLAEDGMVDKLIGDAILTVFGVPYPLENAAGHALRCAERMQAALAELNRDHPVAPGVEVRMGVGIHYGSVIAGTVGKAQRTYTVFGDTVNAANRIEGITKKAGFPILLSQAAFDQLPAQDQARGTPLGEYLLRGKQQKVALYGYGQATPV